MQVLNGSTMRVVLLPEFQYVTVALAGVQCPSMKRGPAGAESEPEPLAREAKYFTETKALNR